MPCAGPVSRSVSAVWIERYTYKARKALQTFQVYSRLIESHLSSLFLIIASSPVLTFTSGYRGGVHLLR